MPYQISYKGIHGRKLIRKKDGKPAEFQTQQKAKNYIRNHQNSYIDLKIESV